MLIRGYENAQLPTQSSGEKWQSKWEHIWSDGWIERAFEEPESQ